MCPTKVDNGIYDSIKSMLFRATHASHSIQCLEFLSDQRSMKSTKRDVLIIERSGVHLNRLKLLGCKEVWTYKVFPKIMMRDSGERRI